MDTNVVSEPMRVRPDPRVLAWLDAQDPLDLWFTSITAGELHAGVEKLPAGEKRASLRSQIHGLLQDFAGRELQFDHDAAQFYGVIAGQILRQHKKIDEVLDVQIAAIAMCHGAAVASRNVKHFAELGIELIDPWTA